MHPKSASSPRTVWLIPGAQSEPFGGELTAIEEAIRTCWDGACGHKSRRLAPATFSTALVITLSKQAMAGMWMEHLARWSYYFEPEMLEGACNRLIQGLRPTKGQMEYLTTLKNTGDDLRNFFRLFSVVHQVPAVIQSLVKIVGQVRDQVRLDELERVRKKARKLLEVVPRCGEVDWPELQTDPAAKAHFLRNRVARMKRFLALKTITAYDFHELKKDFRLVYSVYYQLYPEAARASTGMDTFTGAKKLIKKMHEVLLEQKYKNGIKYRTTPITLPKDFRAHMLRFLGSLKITSRASTGGR